MSDDPPTPCDIVERLVATLKQIKRKDEMTAALERAGVKSHAFSWDQERSMTEYLNDARSQAFIAGAVSSCTAHEMAELLVRGPDERAQRFVLLTAELLSKHDVQRLRTQKRRCFLETVRSQSFLRRGTAPSRMRALSYYSSKPRSFFLCEVSPQSWPA